MLEVDQVRDCKQLQAKGMGIRRISITLGISRNTVRSYLRGDRLPGRYRVGSGRKQPAKDKSRAFARELLRQEIETKTPRKQRLTASRIHRLLKADGQTISGATVRSLVKEIRLDLRDPLKHAFVPLQYDPGCDA